MEPAKEKIVDKLIEMLVEIDWANKELQQKVLYGKNGLKHRFKNYLKSQTISIDNILGLYELIAECMNDYLKEYPAPAYYKENLRQRFWEWFDYSAYNYELEIEDYKPIFDEVVEHYPVDTNIQIIKMLHNQDGITKEEIANELMVSQKTVQSVISRLADKGTDNPIRLGGYPMHIALKTDDKYSENCVYEPGDKYKKRRFYRTEDTMHPVSFQFNMMQVGVMLEALCKSYMEDEVYNAFYIGVNLWCQLSEYAKERVIEVFGKKNEDLLMFIDEIEDIANNHIRTFETEREIMTNGDYKIQEKLLTAHKGAMVCTLELKNPKRRLFSQRVFYDFDKKQYYSVPANNINSIADRIYLEKDINDLYEE